MKSSTYHFHMKTKIFADFQICISVPLKQIYILEFWSKTERNSDILFINFE